jgi:hypothetical protein
MSELGGVETFSFPITSTSLLLKFTGSSPPFNNTLTSWFLSPDASGPIRNYAPNVNGGSDDRGDTRHPPLPSLLPPPPPHH